MTKKRNHYWYNYKTKQHDYATPTDFANYIPQSPACQGLYNCYLTLGETPLESVIKVLAKVLGVTIPESHPGGES